MTTEYKGFKITLTDSFRWQVEGSSKFPFDSYAEVKTHIDEKVKAEEAQNRRRTKIAAIGDSGREYTVTGINVRTGALLTAPKIEAYSGELIYVDIPSCRLILNALKTTAQRAEKLKVLLRQFRLVGMGNTEFDHGEAVDGLEAKAKQVEKIVVDDLEASVAKTEAKKARI